MHCRYAPVTKDYWRKQCLKAASVKVLRILMASLGRATEVQLAHMVVHKCNSAPLACEL